MKLCKLVLTITDTEGNETTVTLDTIGKPETLLETHKIISAAWHIHLDQFGKAAQHG